MANCGIYKKGSDEITYFVKDCVQVDRNFAGSNMRLTGVKEHLFNAKWTEDVANPIYDAHGDIAGYDKKVSELSEALRYKGVVVSNRYDVDKVTRDKIAEEYGDAAEKKLLRLKLAGLCPEQEWNAFNGYIEQLRAEGKNFKDEHFK